MSPVPVQMRQGWAQSWCRCGRGGPSPGADVAGVGSVAVQMWAAVGPVAVQMWQGRAQSRCRCGRGEPSPSAGSRHGTTTGLGRSHSRGPAPADVSASMHAPVAQSVLGGCTPHHKAQREGAPASRDRTLPILGVLVSTRTRVKHRNPTSGVRRSTSAAVRTGQPGRDRKLRSHISPYTHWLLCRPPGRAPAS